jgi:hypothetical protein
MATVITAGNATDGLKITPDNTGILELKTGTGAGTTALTLNASQNATLAGTLQVAGVTTSLYPIVSGTAITLTNQTAPEFTGIPSWVKRITVMLSGVSTNGASTPLIQLGDSGGFETTGYISTGTRTDGTGSAASTSTAGIVISSVSSGNVLTLNATFCLISANSWVCNYSGVSSSQSLSGGGNKTLSDTLDRVRLFIDGTQQFDAGTFNIMWE